MAEENIIFNTQIKTGNSASSIKSVRTELKELTQQMASMEAGSKAFKEAATRAGELQDRIDDAKAAVKAFNPEMKFQAFADVLGGVANGFSAAQGAMALFGSDSKELEKVMSKTQGAIAIATGVNGLMGMKDSIIRLGSIVQKTIPILQAYTAASLGAVTLGIGTAILAIAAYWREIGKAIGFTTETLSEYTDRLDNQIEINKKAHQQFVNAEKDKVDAMQDSRKKDLKLEEIAFNEKKKTIQEEIALKKGSTFASQLELQNAEILHRKKIQDINKKWNDIDEKSRLDKLEAFLKANTDNAEDESLKLFDITTQRGVNELKSLKASDKQINNYLKQRGQERIELESQIQNTITEKNKKDLEKQLSNIDLRYKKGEVTQLESLNKQQNILDDYLKKGLISRQIYDNYDIELDKQKTQTKIEGLQQTSSALQGFAQLAGEQTAEGKALAIASTTIDTFVAAQSAYAAAAKIDPLVLAPLAAAGAVAAGLARVKAITAVQVPKGGGGAPSIGGVAPAAPALPPPSSATRLTNGNEPIITRELNVKENRVYVLEKDITKKQDDVAGIVNKATIQ